MIKARRSNLRRSIIGETIIFRCMLIPFLSLFFLFTVLPVLSSIVLSFFNYDTISTPSFTGFENYLRMFNDKMVMKTLANTLRFAIVTGPISFFMAILLAWLINEFSPIIRTFLSFALYAPALIGSGQFIWQIAFSGDSYGYINNTLLSIGLITEPIQWFRNPSYNMTIIMIIQLWMSLGVSFLANIAGLQNVDNELYEAGAIDGIRSRWHELWYITLPSMKSILFFGAVMQIQSVFSVGAIVSMLAGYPSVSNSVDTFVLLINDVGTMRYEMGYAATLSVLLFSVILFVRFGVGGFMNLVGKQD